MSYELERNTINWHFGMIWFAICFLSVILFCFYFSLRDIQERQSTVDRQLTRKPKYKKNNSEIAIINV